ncbi:MAG TPA: cytochrome b/b6 domain-containing protein, partial [Novosphingobium sp.]|nr:cytochrome b/b6 domain-containing protein [Novosphingobium sp.]
VDGDGTQDGRRRITAGSQEIVVEQVLTRADAVARDLHLTRADWHPARMWQAIARHGAENPHRYNPVQKLAYGLVLFGLLPCLIATGLAMSPGMDAAWPWLTEVWGGRQSARSVHFVCTFALVGFVVVHLVMVVLSGPLEQVRAMITGGGSKA